MISKLFRGVLIAAVLISAILIGIRQEQKKEVNAYILPNLPRPIAKEAVLIASAGQSTDIYIIKDIANQMMIRNFFMPQAKEKDLEDINTLVFVVGYSPMGTQIQGISYENEKERIEKLLEKAENKSITVLTVFIGGKQRRGQNTDELLKLISSHTDYLIGLSDSNYDNLLSELAKDNNIPLTLVKGVNDISGPFASAFR